MPDVGVGMKHCFGTLLAGVFLLAVLPLCGCGDPNKYWKTADITLSSSQSTVVVKREVVLAVQVAKPTDGEGEVCDMTLEYRAEGAGMERVWHPVPGTETARIWALKPSEVGVLSVLARGRCVGVDEDWNYSNQVDVQVTEAVTATTALPSVTAVSLTASPMTVSIAGPHDVTFNLVTTISAGCTLSLKYEYSGGGWTTVQTVDPASQGLFVLTPGDSTPLTVLATGWCDENPTGRRTATVTVTVNP